MNQIVFLLTEHYNKKEYIHCFFEREQEAIDYCAMSNSIAIENELPSKFTYQKVYNFRHIEK